MILVTGSTGTVGSETVRQLYSAGCRVRAVVRDLQAGKAFHPAGVKLVLGEFSDRESLRPALAGIERAMFIGPADQRYVQWCENFIAAAREAGVKHVVKLSALDAGADSPSEIIRQHAETDALLAASGMAYTLLQPNSFYQNMLGMAQAIRTEGKFYFAMGDAAQSMIDARDIAAVAVAALSGAGDSSRTYRLTGPEGLTCHRIAADLSSALGKPVQYVPIPAGAMHDALLGYGMPEWNARALTEIVELFATGQYGYVTEDFENALGRPPVPFSQFAKEFAPLFS